MSTRITPISETTYEKNLRMLEKHQQRNDAKNERASSVTSAS